MTAAAAYSIADLAAAGGVSRRTVRFYVQRGLLPPPEGLGRAARYTDRHLARLLQIKGWQEQAVPLEEIHARLVETERAGSGPVRGGPHRRRRADPEASTASPRWPAPGVPGAGWFRQPLAPGFELHVSHAARPLTAHQLAALARALTDIVKNGGEEE